MNNDRWYEQQKACPICGNGRPSTRRHIREPFKGMFQVQCRNCGVMGPARSTSWAAVMWWNNMHARKPRLSGRPMIVAMDNAR